MKIVDSYFEKFFFSQLSQFSLDDVVRRNS